MKIFSSEGLSEETINKMKERYGKETADAINAVSVAMNNRKMEDVALALTILLCFCVDCADDKRNAAGAVMNMMEVTVNFDEPPFHDREASSIN